MASNAGERLEFRCAVQVFWPGVAELGSLIWRRSHTQNMKTKILSVVAGVTGCLCAAFAMWSVYVAVSVAVAVPAAAGSFDGRYFWWPIGAAVVLWALACFGFVSHRKHRRDHAA